MVQNVLVVLTVKECEKVISDETRDKWKTKIETIFEALNEGQINLNDWEIDFFTSIYGNVINEEKDLSWKQSQALNKLYERIG